MRVPWLSFIVLVGIGKGLRYAFVIWVVLTASG
jgi:membrane protein YqaA with SNARE-associated domain